VQRELLSAARSEAPERPSGVGRAAAAGAPGAELARPAPLHAPVRLTTRRRLVLAFAALATAFAAAFGSVLVGLARMDEQLS
jgi:hypothetical protein